jgi:fermentation-respiration switch protein FrsA (DUF1100 family)
MSADPRDDPAPGAADARLSRLQARLAPRSATPRERLQRASLVAALASVLLARAAREVAPGLSGPLLGAGLLLLLVHLGLLAAGPVRDSPRRGATVVVVAVGGLAAVLLSGCLSRPMIFPGCDVAFPAAGAPLPAVRGGASSVVTYVTSDGLELRGAFVRGADVAGADSRSTADRAIAVHFHGNAESAAQNLDLAHALADAGVDVFLAEYRGYGGQPGSPSETGLLDDARAAIAAAARVGGVSEARLILVGRSLGTGVVAAMLAEGRGRAGVLISPYTSILDLAAAMVSRPIAWLAVVDTFRSLERLRTAPQPVVIYHGTQDTVIPFAHGQALAEALGPRARLVPVPRRDHNDVLFPLEPLLAEVARIDRETR